MSVASLLQMHIRGIKYKILASQGSFSTQEPSLSWQSRERADSGDKITRL